MTTPIYNGSQAVAEASRTGRSITPEQMVERWFVENAKVHLE